MLHRRPCEAVVQPAKLAPRLHFMGDKNGISQKHTQHICIQLAVDSTLIMQMMQADDRIGNEVSSGCLLTADTGVLPSSAHRSGGYPLSAVLNPRSLMRLRSTRFKGLYYSHSYYLRNIAGCLMLVAELHQTTGAV